MLKVKAQSGPQHQFLSCDADIVFYGGAAGGGKSFGLLMEPIRHIHNPLFGGVIFRRTTVQIRNQGGLWDTSQELYPLVGGRAYSQKLEWRFPSGARIRLAHMEHDKNRFDWQGTQIPYIGFDEACQFSASQFWYMLGRNRSTSGVAGYIRAACNPDPDSFVRELIDWWIDPDTGFPIKARAGVVRWFQRDGDRLVWGDSREEVVKAVGLDADPKSLTFIPASVYDNKILLAKDPKYLSNLKNLPSVDRQQLLDGNWNVRPCAGLYFKREWFPVIEAAPIPKLRVRYWDRAATEKRADNEPDWTSGVLLSKTAEGRFVIEDVRRMRESAHKVEQAILNTAAQDGKKTIVAYNQDPGSAGKGEAEQMAAKLAGYTVKFKPCTGDKETRAKPASAQAEAGNISIVAGKWNKEFLTTLENFPEGIHDDDVDGLSGAFDVICTHKKIYLF